MLQVSDKISGSKNAPDRLMDAIELRFSPKSFSNDPLDEESLDAILRAAVSAPSSYNEQPWKFRILKRETHSFQELLGTLSESNREWAQNAPALIIAYSKRLLDRTGGENNFSMYDLGQSIAYLTLEAMSRGIYSHQMGGFNRQKAAELFGIGAEYNPVVVIALGKLDTTLITDISPETVAARRRRKPLEDFIVL